VSFDKKLIGGGGGFDSESIDVSNELRLRLRDPLSWRTELPAAGGQIVGVEIDPPGGIAAHPGQQRSQRQAHRGDDGPERAGRGRDEAGWPNTPPRRTQAATADASQRAGQH
jgi:hypothetical protein